MRGLASPSTSTEIASDAADDNCAIDMGVVNL
jgi:hypothetical protein